MKTTSGSALCGLSTRGQDRKRSKASNAIGRIELRRCRLYLRLERFMNHEP